VRVGVFLFGAVEMDDLGDPAVAPLDRRYGVEEVHRATGLILDTAVLADELGYDTFWLTEHHFQHEGYEVVPNALLLGAFMAERTRRIGIGAMFNVLGQWHPLRLAEDFATLHNLSGGRAVLGVGRGTVPREMVPLSSGRASVGSSDNPDQTAADVLNREVSDESLDLLLAALDTERFCHRGKHFQAPPTGIPDRGGEVEHLTLVPRPRHPYAVWQAVTSPGSLRSVPVRGFGGVFWLLNRDVLRERWAQFADNYAAAHGVDLAAGEKRTVVVNTWIEDTHGAAVERARPGHDEFWRFLGPYGWTRGYRGPDGGPPPPGWVPTLEDSMAQGTWVVGTAVEVADGLRELRADLGGLTELTLFPSAPGDTYAATQDQLRRFAAEVRPALEASVEVA
jgi:alkanesulfonate monooxygenase SsuD/methylene tetrahydromethanopterin reductase-like flavin-dependent oxidoreductase (luciferase family)